MLKKNILFLFFFPFLLFAQKSKEQKEIDSLIEVYYRLDGSTDNKKMLRTAKVLLLKSEKYESEKGLAIGNALIGYSLSRAGKYKESIKYINKSNLYSDYLKKDSNQRNINYNFLAFNYQQLGLYTLALEGYRKSLTPIINKKNKTLSDISIQKSFYVNLANLYNVMKKYDSAYYYYKKSIEINQNDTSVRKTYLINGLGYYFLHTKKSDSARYYYQKSLGYFKQKEEHYNKADAFTGLANAYSLENNFPKAINFSLKAMKIYEDLNVINGEINIYKSISDYYNKNGNYEEGKIYLEKYLRKKDSLELVNKKEADFVVSEVMSLERTQQDNIRKENFKITGIIIGLLSLLLLVVLFFNKKSNDKKTSKVNELLQKKEEETQRLKQKLNESFGGVVRLAKENSPEFFTRFQEVYPKFRNKLLQINPDLKITELTLCAYIYLGFNTKDIAEYTFKAEKTIRNNKHNIRKRLDVPAKSDFTIWLHNQTDS